MIASRTIPLSLLLLGSGKRGSRETSRSAGRVDRMISAAIFDLSCVPALNHNLLLERANPVLAGNETFQNCANYVLNFHQSRKEGHKKNPIAARSVLGTRWVRRGLHQSRSVVRCVLHTLSVHSCQACLRSWAGDFSLSPSAPHLHHHLRIPSCSKFQLQSHIPSPPHLFILPPDSWQIIRKRK